MPPRLPIRTTASPSSDALFFLSNSSSSVSSSSSSLITSTSHQICLRRRPQCPSQQSSRPFSGTSAASSTGSAIKLRKWIQTKGRIFNNKGLQGRSAQELKDDPYPQFKAPFPTNPYFKNMPVLSEQARELIWSKVMEKGEPIKAVSAELGVDIRRVAAVVRLKEVEKKWIAQGKTLAKPYAKAMLSLLPKKFYDKNEVPTPFEPINEIPVHPYTKQQLFVPTSESRHFAREDAAKAFHRHLLSADDRIPHPEFVGMERAIAEGQAPVDAKEAFVDAAARFETDVAAKTEKAKAQLEKRTTHVKARRGEFRFENIDSEKVGKDGRALTGVGWRYGVAFYDRKKGEVKIPTSVA